MAGTFELRLKTPAKVNLYLKITGIRDDGYHLLDSLFVPVSLYDEILIGRTNRRGIQVRFDIPGIDPLRNSVYKAAELFMKKMDYDRGYRIRVKKRIPPGSGMGGGSSDAAAVLKGLNLLHGCPFATDELREMGLEIGADVPFFIDCVPARVRGIGEIQEKVPLDRKIWLILIYPGFESSTPLIYKAFDNLTNNLQNIKIKQANFEDLPLGENDLEEAFLNVYDSGRALRDRITSFPADFRGMSGSGSTWFLGFFNRRRRDEVLREVRRVIGDSNYKIFGVNILQ